MAQLETQVYWNLFFAVVLYAVFLQLFKHLWETYLTWLEVVIGVAMCLAVPWYLKHQVLANADDYQRWTWTAFGIGGGVIIAWQVVRMVYGLWVTQAETRRLMQKDMALHADAAAALAEESGTYSGDREADC